MEKDEKVTNFPQATNEPEEGSLANITVASLTRGNNESAVSRSTHTSSQHSNYNLNDLSPQTKNTRLPTPSTLNYLADLYWKYPTVHQEICAYPLHTNHAIVAAARLKGERLRQELEKEPERHRLSKEDPPIHVKGYKNPKPKNRQPTLAPVKRRTVNQSLVEIHKKKSIGNTRRSLVKGNRKPTYVNESGEALAEFRKTKGYVLDTSGNNDDNRGSRSLTYVDVNEQTPVILDAIREQEEDVEKENNKRSGTCDKCCQPLKNCIGSYRCKCIAFVVLVTIIIMLCIVAVIYPVVKVLLLYQHDHVHNE